MIKTPYGIVTLHEPVLQELLASSAVQRMKKLHQYGVRYYLYPQEDFLRYDHSVGVLALLQKAEVNLEEQIAGLLHDVSHTVFSHVGDYIFDHLSPTSSYQDDIHEWHVNQTDIPLILKRHGLTVQDILHKDERFTALEQDLPHLCADRIQYILHGGLVEQAVSEKEIEDNIAHLYFKDGTWFYDDTTQARVLGDLSLMLTEKVFTSLDGLMCYQLAADIIKKAYARNIVSSHELHFSTDDVIWQKLLTCNDQEITTAMNNLVHHRSHMYQHAPHDKHTTMSGKFRGVNPRVATSHGLQSLTTLDPAFAEEFKRVQEKVSQGWHVKMNSLNKQKETSMENDGF